MYVRLPARTTQTVTITNTQQIVSSVSMRTPLRYTAADLPAVSVNGYRVSLNDYNSYYNPYLQAAEYAPMSNTSFNLEHGENTVRATCGDRACNLLLFVGSGYRLTPLEIVSLPISMARVHGSYWTRQYYYWIFYSVAIVLAGTFVLCNRLRPWQRVLVLAMTFFASGCCEKLYHAILAATKTGDTRSVAFAVVLVAICSEVLPLLFCMAYLKHGKYKPVPWSLVGVTVATGFLFLGGSGWFAGVGLLGAASLLRLAQRAL